jgi:cytochrome c oxidase assembly protein subunit 15
MPATALYDLSPALRLMIMGLIVASGPLVWVWLRSRDATAAGRLEALTLVTLFLTFDLVIFGAFTRLTDSGLGCPDWPGCYGHASPLGAQLHIGAAQAVLPDGPVTPAKAWIEMVHRYLATGVGVLILALAAATWVKRARLTDSGRINRGAGQRAWWATATLLWVCLQGAFGALTVTMKLFPAIVTMHLLGGMVLLALLKAQASRYAQAYTQDAGELVTMPVSPGARRLALLTYALLWLQIALGGWVSTNYAVLACASFPACQGSLWPAMDFSQGFTLWRELGAGPDGANISFQALTAIHYVHRLVAYIVFAAMLLLAFRLRREPALRAHARWLAGLAFLQLATGLGNVLLGWPLIAAVSHTGGAAALVIVLTGIVCSTRAASSAALAGPAATPRVQGLSA